jgi:hypothetical protein
MPAVLQTGNGYVTVQCAVRPVKRHGLELWHALVVGPDDAVLLSTMRWSEADAHASVQRWVTAHGGS